MAKEPQTNAAPAVHSPIPNFSNWATPMMSGWGRAAEAYMAACQEWNQEVLGFLNRRFEADMSAQRAIASCPDLLERGKLQQDWAKNMAEAYSDEAKRLLDIATRCGQSMTAPPEAK